MIFGILKDGVRSAFVKLVRIITFAILILVGFYIFGLLTSSKASALTIKENLYDPDINNKSQYHYFSTDTQHWYYFGFTSNWTNTTDYDIVGFHMNKAVAEYDQTQIDNPNLQHTPLDMINYTGILWEADGYGVICYMSTEYDNFILCPITKGTSYNGFTIVANTITIYGHYVIYNEIEVERNKTFFNFDSTDIINGITGNGGFSSIVIEQQQTTQAIENQTQAIEDQTQAIEDQTQVAQDTYDYITDSSTTQAETQTTTELTGISGQFNDILNGWGGQWSGLTHVVLEPINVLLYAFDNNTTCSPIRLNIPYLNDGQYIDLPCMSGIYNNYFGTFLSIFVTIISGLYAYRTILMILRTLKEVTDAENDKIEVIDL